MPPSPEAAADAAKGASVIYRVPERPVQPVAGAVPAAPAAVFAAAERTGALLVHLENLYGYGPTSSSTMTEDMPLATTGVKGRARAAMTAELLAAAGPAGSGSPSGRPRTSAPPASPRAPRWASGSSATPWPGGRAASSATQDPHTYRYVPDIAVGLAALGTDARAVGRVRAPARPATSATRALLDLVRASSRGILSASGRCPPRPCACWAWSTRCCGAGRDVLSVRRAVRAGHQRVPGRVRHAGAELADAIAASSGLVPDPARHAMTTNPEAVNAMQVQLTDITAQPQAANPADLTPAAAWSRRVRRIGGLIQAAFAAFWLARADLPRHGGRAGDVLMAQCPASR